MWQAELLGVGLRLVLLYQPLAFEVRFVAHNDDWQVSATLRPELLYPGFHPFEGVQICYVVHNQSAQRPSIVDLVQRAIPLLAGSVVHREPVDRLLASARSIVYAHGLLEHRGVHSAGLAIAKMVFCEPKREGCLAYSG